jgi:hypothetical protein
MGDVFGFLAVAFIIWIIFIIGKNLKSDPNEEKQQQNDYEAGRILRTLGPVSPNYICPHCQTKGFVRTIPVKRKKGVSGAKVTGAILTMGVSMLATGLSRKEGLTQAHCGNCDSTWDF